MQVYLLWMVDHTGDLLAVTLKNGDDLFSVLVEYDGVLVVTTCRSNTVSLSLSSLHRTRLPLPSQVNAFSFLHNVVEYSS